MAHKRKRRSERREPEKPETSSRRKFIPFIAIGIVVVIVIAFVLSYLLFLAPTSDNDEPPEFGIQFPRDEGQHNESLEIWKVDFLLENQAGDRFSINVDYYIDESGLQERVMSFTDEGNISGRDFVARAHSGLVNVGYTKLNLTFVSALGSDSWNGEYNGNFEYTYQGEVYDGASEFYFLDLQMTSVKDPILLGDDGITLLEGSSIFGTFKGYTITRLTVTGTMRFAGLTHTVTGYSWILHEWGGWTVFGIEEFRLQLGATTELYLLRFFDPVDNIVFEEMFYLSDANGKVTKPDEYDLENLEYWVDPRFEPSTTRVLPSRWSLECEPYDVYLDIWTTVDYQIEKRHYEGSAELSGSIGGLSVQGRGFVTLNRHYFSTPSIDQFYRNDEIHTAPVLYANISNQIPMRNASLVYRADGSNWLIEPMTDEGGDLWKATIYVAEGTQVEAYVDATDRADKRVTSEPMFWTV